jgi:hypothetical protein
MRRLAILFVATTALSAVGLCPPMPVPVATAGARPDIIGIDSVSVLPSSTHISAFAGVATAGTDRARDARGGANNPGPRGDRQPGPGFTALARPPISRPMPLLFLL